MIRLVPGGVRCSGTATSPKTLPQFRTLLSLRPSYPRARVRDGCAGRVLRKKQGLLAAIRWGSQSARGSKNPLLEMNGVRGRQDQGSFAQGEDVREQNF